MAVSAAVMAMFSCLLDFCIKAFVLNIAGVVITFFYGMPQPPYELQGVLVVEDGNVDTDGVSFGKKRSKGAFQRYCHTISAYLGLCYLLSGFVLQLIHQVWHVD